MRSIISDLICRVRSVHGQW